MRILHLEHTFHWDWDVVVEGVWNKYPTPKDPRVISVEIVKQDVSEDGNVVTTDREVKTINPAPKYVVMVLKDAFVWFDEHSVLDKKTKTLTQTTTLRTFSRYIHAKERTIYTVDDNDERKTALVQHGHIKIKGLGVFNRPLEMFLQKFAYRGAARGFAIFHEILEEKYGEPCEPQPNWTRKENSNSEYHHEHD